MNKEMLQALEEAAQAITRLRQNLKDLGSRLEALEKRNSGNDVIGVVTQLQQNLKKLDGRIAGLEQGQKDTRAKIEEHEGRLDAIDQGGDGLSDSEKAYLENNKFPDSLKKIYVELRQRVRKFGPDVKAYATNQYLAFNAGYHFACIQLRKRESALYIDIRPEGLKEIPENNSAEVYGIHVTRAPDSHGWSCNHNFLVYQYTNLDGVTKLLRQSYEGVRNR